MSALVTAIAFLISCCFVIPILCLKDHINSDFENNPDNAAHTPSKPEEAAKAAERGKSQEDAKK